MILNAQKLYKTMYSKVQVMQSLEVYFTGSKIEKNM